MSIKRFATVVASLAVAAALAGVATTTVAPANTDGGTAIGAAYSAATGKWGFGKDQPNMDAAYSAAKAACTGNGGTDYKVVGGAISGCQALVVKDNFGSSGFGDPPAAAAADALSILPGGTVKDTQCSSAPAAPANVPKQGPTVSPNPDSRVSPSTSLTAVESRPIAHTPPKASRVASACLPTAPSTSTFLLSGYSRTGPAR
jgi:hypothetical protein